MITFTLENYGTGGWRKVSLDDTALVSDLPESADHWIGMGMQLFSPDWSIVNAGIGNNSKLFAIPKQPVPTVAPLPEDRTVWANVSSRMKDSKFFDYERVMKKESNPVDPAQAMMIINVRLPLNALLPSKYDVISSSTEMYKFTLPEGRAIVEKIGTMNQNACDTKVAQVLTLLTSLWPNETNFDATLQTLDYINFEVPPECYIQLPVCNVVRAYVPWYQGVDIRAKCRQIPSVDIF